MLSLLNRAIEHFLPKKTEKPDAPQKPPTPISNAVNKEQIATTIQSIEKKIQRPLTINEREMFDLLPKNLLHLGSQFEQTSLTPEEADQSFVKLVQQMVGVCPTWFSTDPKYPPRSILATTPIPPIAPNPQSQETYLKCPSCSALFQKYRRPYCDSCERVFCSESCAKIEAYEDTFPNCCPGVYWCGLCRNNYFDKANGHLFMMANHPNHPDLLTYLGIVSYNGAFVDQCSKCGVWSYEFRSKTSVPGKYEGQACDATIREIEKDY